MNHKAVCRTAPATPGLLKSRGLDKVFQGLTGAAEENPEHPDSFTLVYIISEICLHIFSLKYFKYFTNIMQTYFSRNAQGMSQSFSKVLCALKKLKLYLDN